MRDDAPSLLVPALQSPPAAPAGRLGPEIDREAADWARRHGLYASAERRRRLVRQRFGSLAARVCPDADREGLALYAQWMCLGWFYEEEFFRPARTGGGAARENARRAADAAMATVSALVPGGMHGLPRAPEVRRRYRLEAVTDLMRRTARAARLEQFSRLGTALVLHLARQVSDEEPAPGSPVASPCLVVAEIASGCPATGADLASPQLRRLTALAVERAAWCLRVHTATRWRGMEDVLAALPAALRPGTERFPQRALDRAARLHDERATAYDRLERSVRRGANAVQLAYLDLLRGWLRALYDWSRPLATVPGPLILLPSAFRAATAIRPGRPAATRG